MSINSLYYYNVNIGYQPIYQENTDVAEVEDTSVAYHAQPAKANVIQGLRT